MRFWKRGGVEIALIHRERLLRQVLGRILDDTPGFRVTAASGSAGEAVRMAMDAAPDILVVDEDAVDVRPDGILRALRDALGTGALVLLVEDPTEELVASARDAGVDAFAVKSGSVSSLVDTIRRVHARRPSRRWLRV